MPTGPPEIPIPNSLITDFHRSVSPASNASVLSKVNPQSLASNGGPVQMQTNGAYPQPPFTGTGNGAAYLSAPLPHSHPHPHDPRQPTGYGYPPPGHHIAYQTSQNGSQHPSGAQSQHNGQHHSRLAYEGPPRPGSSRRDSYQHGQFSGMGDQHQHVSGPASHSDHAYPANGQAYAPNGHFQPQVSPYAHPYSPHPQQPQQISTPTGPSYATPLLNGQNRGSQTPQAISKGVNSPLVLPLAGPHGASQTPNGPTDSSIQIDTPTKLPTRKRRGRPPGSATRQKSIASSVGSAIVESSAQKQSGKALAVEPSTPGSAQDDLSHAPPRPSKRQRIIPPEHDSASVQSANSQLPTPPSTSSLPPASDEDAMVIDSGATTGLEDGATGARPSLDAAGALSADTDGMTDAIGAPRGSLSITQDDQQGRRIEFSAPQFSTAVPNPAPPRYVPTLVLVSNEKGEASVNQGEMLESEVAPVAGPSQPTPPLTTPPSTAAKQLPYTPTAFSAGGQFGAPALQPRDFDFEQFRSDGAGVGIADLPDVGRVLTIPSERSNPLKPSWPDRDTPFASDSDWALGGKRKSVLASRNKRRTAMIERYCQSDSDNSDNEPSTSVPNPWDRKGKNPIRNYQGAIQQEWFSKASSDAVMAATYAFRNRPLRIAVPEYFDCHCHQPPSHDDTRVDWAKCYSCLASSHAGCYTAQEIPQLTGQPFYCRQCREKAAAMVASAAATPVQQTRGYVQSERSSAFKNQGTVDIALAPSPQFTSFERGSSNARTPLSRAIASASSPIRTQSARQLSYNVHDFLTFPDAADGPETPTAPSRGAPKVDDLAFDVNSTPSRHIPVMSSGPFLTPHWESSRHISFAASPRVQLGYGAAPSAAATAGSSNPASLSGALDFSSPAGPSRAHRALGNSHVSPSPYGHRRRSSGGNRMSSLRSSALGGGLASAFGDDFINEEDEGEASSRGQ